jgi:hypothetical protein
MTFGLSNKGKLSEFFWTRLKFTRRSYLSVSIEPGQHSYGTIEKTQSLGTPKLPKSLSPPN